MDLSLIICCYNEEPHLEDSFGQIKNLLGQTVWKYEFVFVDDFSVDATREIVRRIIADNPGLQIKAIYHECNMGRGRSVADGIRAASGRVVGFIDIDLETPAHYIIPAVSMVRAGDCDLVSAHRIYKLRLRDLSRAVLSRGYNLLVRVLLRLPFVDTEAGFKSFDRAKIISVLDQTQNQRWFWDTEIMARSFAAGLKICLLPTLFVRDRRKKTTVRIFRDSFGYLMCLLKFRKDFFKKIKHSHDHPST